MRFLYAFPHGSAPLPDDLVTGSAIATLASAAEAAGFDAVACYEHPAPSERWRRAGGHDALDPYVTLAYAAAVTSRVRLLSYLTPLAYRNPFLLAKAVATLDRLSGGRAVLGAGVGYLRAEFAAVGAEYDSRGEVADEAIRTIVAAWAGDVVSCDGRAFQARGIRSLPTPVQLPHPPIWIGGNSRRARRRVASSGNAWMPMPVTAELRQTTGTAAIAGPGDLEPLVEELHQLTHEAGRPAVDVVFPVRPPGVDAPLEAHLETVARLAEVGVTWAAVNGVGTTVGAAEEWIGRYGADVIGAFRAGTGE